MASSVQNLDPWCAVDDLTPGNARLRRQIALRYLADGLQVHTDEIVVTNGALEALNLCLSAVTRPGDAVLIESPTFHAALQALERLGLEAIEVPTHPREGMDLDALERAIQRHHVPHHRRFEDLEHPFADVEWHRVVLRLRRDFGFGRKMPGAVRDVVARALTRSDEALRLEQVVGLEHGGRTHATAGTGLADGG